VPHTRSTYTVDGSDLEPNLLASSSSSPPNAPDENSTITLGPEQDAVLLKPDFNKEVPPTPHSGSDEETEEAPEINLPELVAPSMFLPIPNVQYTFSIRLSYREYDAL
jgi:hypothetical protein